MKNNRSVIGCLVAAFIVLVSPLAFGQGGILQGGPATPGHSLMFLQNGIAQDGGSAAGGGVGVGLSELLQVSRAPGTGPFATHNCFYDAAITNSAGYHYICFDPNALGGGLIAYGAGGAASTLPLSISVNGVLYPFPGAGTGNVIGPTSPYPTTGDVAAWNGGTTLADSGVLAANILKAPSSVTVGDALCASSRTQSTDCGIVPLANVPTVAILRAMPTTTFSNGATFPVQGYRTPGIGSGQWTWNSSNSCASGVTWCVTSTGTGGGTYIFSSVGILSPLQFGAYGDGQQLTAIGNVTVVNGNPSVTVTGGTYSSANNGALVTITDYVNSTIGNLASYQGSITAASGTALTVSPNPGFSTSSPQTVNTAHDDAAALNIATSYIASLRNPAAGGVAIGPSSAAQLDGGGLTYGVCSAPWTVAADIVPTNMRVMAMCSSAMPIAGTGAAGVVVLTGGTTANASGGSYTGSQYFVIDSGLLPVNGLYANVNGHTHWHDFSVVNWRGHDSGVSFTATGSTTSNQITVGSASGLSSGMVSHGNNTACAGSTTGIPDRTAIVGISGTTVTLNKAPTGTCTSASLAFYNDASGIVEPVGSGMHNTDVLESQLENSTYQSVNANHYGYGLLFNGSQADMSKWIAGGGVAQIFMGSTGAGLSILDGSVLFGHQYGSEEDNAASVIMADGAGPLYMDNTGVTALIQLWDVTGAQGTPTLGISHLTPSYNANVSNYFTPNNWVQLNTYQANTPTLGLHFTADWDLGTHTPGVSYATEGSGSWVGISSAQATTIAASFAYESASGSNGPFSTVGANLNAGVLTAPERCKIGINGTTYTYAEGDTGCSSNLANANPLTLTLPNTLGLNGAWYQKIAAYSSTAVTLTMASGGTLNGISSGSIPILSGFNYSVECPRNIGGTSAACFVNYTAEVTWNCAIPTTSTSGATTLTCFSKIVNPSTVDAITTNLSGTSASGASVTLFECGTSTTCATPTTIGTRTSISSVNTALPVTISSATITAGDYIAAEITAGTLTSIAASVNVQMHQN